MTRGASADLFLHWGLEDGERRRWGVKRGLWREWGGGQSESASGAGDVLTGNGTERSLS